MSIVDMRTFIWLTFQSRKYRMELNQMHDDIEIKQKNHTQTQTLFKNLFTYNKYLMKNNVECFKNSKRWK